VAEVGQSISNPATGERVEFLQTRETTNGEVLEFELTLAPFGRVGGVPHQHPAEETVDVLEGVLSCRLRHERREVRPGERLVLPERQGHFLFNDTDRPVRARVAARPALDFETFFETVFAIAHRRQYKAFRGLPAPLHAALLSRTYDVYAPAVPIPIQRAALDALVPLARKRGYPVRLPPLPDPS
jgi:quercetin dioxygenase-like cupin family protein